MHTRMRIVRARRVRYVCQWRDSSVLCVCARGFCVCRGAAYACMGFLLACKGGVFMCGSMICVWIHVNRLGNRVKTLVALRVECVGS